MRIVSDGLFFYTRISDSLVHDIIEFFNDNQTGTVTNIAGKSLARNGFVKFPLGYYPKWIKILEDFCSSRNIELIYADCIDSTGDRLIKLTKLFSE